MVRAIFATLLTLGIGAPLLAQAVAPAAAKSERYAFLVAVREYPRAKLGKLPFVENDIEQLAAVLLAAGYKEENIVRLSQSLAGQEGPGKGARYFPSGENVRRELKVLLGGLGKDDSVLVAFAGHGVQFQKEKEAYFCPADANLEQVESLLAISEIYAQLKASPARVKVLLVDACRNDPALARSRGPKGIELEPVGKPQEIEPPKGIAALFSCSPGQQAWEDVELKHGIFFHFIIAGLKGAADANSDGSVTYNELSDYSINEVKRLARVKHGELQVPQQKGEFEGQIALVKIERPVGPMPMPPMPAPMPSPPFVLPPGAPPLAIVPFDASTAKKHQQDWAAYVRAPTVAMNSVNMKLTLIPPGEFLMGALAGETELQADEMPPHRVRITKPFYIGLYEVTQSEYKAIMGENPSYYSPTGKRKDQVAGLDTTRFPVDYVSWDDATEFCRRLNQKEGRAYRLPTEAEWEYACRAGTTTPFHFGGESNGDKANVDGGIVKGRFLARTTTVGSYAPNAFGLYDMHGNVSEWCADRYDEKYYETLAGRTSDDPTGDAEADGRVLRGSSCFSISTFIRAASRSVSIPDSRSNVIGFRIVLPVRTP